MFTQYGKGCSSNPKSYTEDGTPDLWNPTDVYIDSLIFKFIYMADACFFILFDYNESMSCSYDDILVRQTEK